MPIRDLVLIVLVAAAARVVYVALLGDVIGADEAVNALIALAIARGQEFPVLMWEAHYSGTIVDYLAAGLFLVFGPSTTAFRVPGALLGVVVAVIVAVTARALWGRGAGLVAGLWLALGPPLLTRLTAQTPGGYPEALVFGALTLWLAVGIARRADASLRRWAALGAAGGVGAWSLPLVLPPLAGCLMTLRHRLFDHGGRAALVGAVTFFVGAAPFLIYNVTHPAASFLRLGGRVTGVSSTDVRGAESKIALAVDAATRYLRGRLAFLAALPGQVLGALGPMPLVILVVIAAACVVLLLWPRDRAPARASASGIGSAGSSSALGWRLIGWSGLALFLFVLLLDLVEPRHLAPAHVLVALALGGLWAGALLSARPFAAVAVAAWMALNLTATLQEASRAAPSVVSLTRALEAGGVTALYTDYNVAYPIMWESRDRILASPAAGPVNVDRRPAVSRRVEATARPAYVFAAGSEAGATFTRELTRVGVAWTHARVADFDVFQPDRHVRPGELRLLRLFAVDSASTGR